MANYYRDNDDIQFLVRHIELGKLAEFAEEELLFYWYVMLCTLFVLLLYQGGCHHRSLNPTFVEIFQ